MTIFGRKTITLPTPPIMPSTIRSCKMPLGRTQFINSDSASIAFSIHSCGYLPNENVQ